MEAEVRKIDIKRIVNCAIMCINNEMKYIADYDQDTKYNFDSLHIHRVSYILSLLYKISEIRLSDNLYKCLYFKFGPLLKDITYEEFYQDVTLDIHSYNMIISDFKQQLNKIITTIHNMLIFFVV